MKPTSTNTQPIERDIEAGNQAADTGRPIADNAEQAADLAALHARAAGEPGQAVAVVEEEKPTLQQEIAASIGMAVGLLGPMFPSLRTIYTPEAIGAASGALGAVCEKHGLLKDGLMGKYAIEFACLGIVGPLAFATVVGVRGDLAAMAKKKPIEATAKQPGGIDVTAPAPAPAPAPGEATAPRGPAVTFGAPA